MVPGHAWGALRGHVTPYAGWVARGRVCGMEIVNSFSSRETFLGVPREAIGGLGERRPEIAIVGAPFDWGTSYRPGARFGPREIRRACYNPAIPSEYYALSLKSLPLADLSVVDVGDVGVIPGYIEDSLNAIAGAVQAIAAAGTVPIILGGDHTIAFPDMTGIARVRGAGSFGVVHFDAHADTGEDFWGYPHSHGTPMRRLIESGAVRGDRFVQVGLRGYWPDAKTFAWMEQQGIRSIFMHEVEEMGLNAAIDEAVRLAGSGTDGIFLSIDIDVVDPGSAPGTGTPEPGGMLPRELLRAVRRLALEQKIVGVEVVEVAPAYDHADVTSLLASRTVLEILAAMAVRKRTH